MRIMYVTDLHGDERKYRKALDVARARDVEAVVNGGDMYPKNIALEQQHAFITGFLDYHFTEYERSGIYYLCMPGNDDLAAFDEPFGSTCRAYTHVFNIAQRKVTLGGFEFVGFNLVADYPFGLKDRCRMDTARAEFPEQLGLPVVSDGSWPEFRGLKPLDDWFAFARAMPTIEDELKCLEKPRNPKKAIYVIHMPPSRLGLDVCFDGSEAGSQAVRSFLVETQPRLALHGHIHESPQVSGAWKVRLGHTVSVQPGQMKRLTYVIMDLNSMEMERVVE